MTDATLRARPDEGGRVTVALADTILSDSPALLVEIDRRSVEAWREPHITTAADRVTIAGTLATSGRDAEHQLHATWSARRIAGEPVWEHSLVLRKTSSARSPAMPGTTSCSRAGRAAARTA